MQLKWVDRGACLLLVLFAAGHAFIGTLMIRPWTETGTLWSVSGSLAAWMIAALNWLRSGRPHDKALTFWSLVGAVAWICLMIWLMEIAGMWRDPRPWLFILVSLVLSAFSVHGLFGVLPLAERPEIG
jgi:hypothetical protein